MIHSRSPEDEYYFEEGCYILELSNSPDDEAVSIARARVPAGVTTQRHRLKGIAERYVILEGEGWVEVGSEPGKMVGVGDVVVIPPGVNQRISNRECGDLIFLAVCSPRFVPEAYELSSNHF